MTTKQSESDIKIKASATEAIAESIVPYYFDSQYKRQYLAYRACGFTIREACRLVGIHQSTPSMWSNKDPDFSKAEKEALTTLRQTLAKEHISIEFLRNYMLVMRRDFQVLDKSVRSLVGKTELTPHEQQYLLKARGHYTPQQLQILQQLFTDKPEGERSFADIVKALSESPGGIVGIRRTQEEVIVGR